MTALSDLDIKRELGKNILIYPLTEKNIKNASYNLTASKLAWNVATKESIYHSEYKRIKTNNNQKNEEEILENVIVIPPETTALIYTNETIWVSSKICGSYHSKVYWSSKGLGHIGTTLDPEYIGPSLVPVHNHRDKEIIIYSEKETFVSIMFFYVKTQSLVSDTNRPGRIDILQNYILSEKDTQWIDETFRKDKIKLEEKLLISQEYKDIKKVSFNHINLLPYIIFGLFLFLIVVIFIFISIYLSDHSLYNNFVTGLITLAVLVILQAIIQLIKDIQNS